MSGYSRFDKLEIKDLTSKLVLWFFFFDSCCTVTLDLGLFTTLVNIPNFLVQLP